MEPILYLFGRYLFDPLCGVICNELGPYVFFAGAPKAAATMEWIYFVSGEELD